MGVLWKMVTVILNHRLGTDITFQGVLHGFCTSRVMGANYLEAYLLQYLDSMREEVLYKIFLDLYKSYDDLDRFRFLDIIVVYSMGPRYIRLLQRHLDCLIMVAKDGEYCGTPFKGYFRGHTGRGLFPTLLNVVVRAMIWHCIVVVVAEEVGLDGFGGVVQRMENDK